MRCTGAPSIAISNNYMTAVVLGESWCHSALHACFQSNMDMQLLYPFFFFFKKGQVTYFPSCLARGVCPENKKNNGKHMVKAIRIRKNVDKITFLNTFLDIVLIQSMCKRKSIIKASLCI